MSASVSSRVPSVVVLCVILLALVGPVETLPRDRLYEAWWRFLHFPALALGTILLAKILPFAAVAAAPKAVGIALLAVPLMEALQFFTGRTPAWGDILMGWAGVMAGGACLIVVFRKERRVRMTGVAMVLVLTLLAVLPAVSVVVDRRMAERAYPLLASFRTPMEVGRWVATSATVQRSREYAAYGEYALAVTLHDQADYPGVFMTDFHADWSDMQALHVDIHLTGDNELNGWIRVDDKVEPEYADRFQESVRLRPGHNTIRLDLTESFMTPRGRPLRKESIHTWGVFFDRAGTGRVFHLDAAYLSGTAEQ